MRSVRAQLLVTLAAVLVAAGFFLHRGPPPDRSLWRTVPYGGVRELERHAAWGNDLRARDGAGETLLHHAAYYSRTDIAAHLIGRGLDVDVRTTGEAMFSLAGETPLHYAIEWSREKPMVELLIAKGADVRATDELGRTALHRAARAHWLEVVRLLIAEGADVNSADSDGWTPLFDAVYEEPSRPDDVEPGIVVALLLEKGARVDVADREGRTPLHWAVQNASEKTVKLLLERGAPVNVADASRGETPLYWAVSQGRIGVARLLIEKGADVSAASTDGFTPLRDACTSSNVDDAIRLDLVRLLLESGADPNTKDCYGGTVLEDLRTDKPNALIDLLRRHGAKER